MGLRSAAPRATNLESRVLSAIVLGPLVLASVFAGGAAFQILVLVAALAGVREWVRLVGGGSVAEGPALELSYAAVLAALIVDIAAGPGPDRPVAGLLGPALSLGLAAVLYAVLRVGGVPRAGWLALGVPYLGLAAVAALWLRDSPGTGLGLTCWLVLAVWATDIGAYAAGRTVGGPKLAPRISPNKTWAGLAGGIVSAAAMGAIVALAFGAARPGVAAGAAAVLAAVAQAGDLFESAVKRRFGVKDSGRLIPGHGGILDRMDGFLAAAPVLAVFHASLGGAIGWW